MRLLHEILFVLLLLTVSNTAIGQGRFSLNPIPLNEPIRVTLLGGDEELLHCYNLYGFSYVTDVDSITGEFVVLKEADSFKNKDFVEVKLCRVHEFYINAGRKCRSMKVQNGILLKYPGQEEKVYMNFDPDGPDPVFIPCK